MCLLPLISPRINGYEWGHFSGTTLNTPSLRVAIHSTSVLLSTPQSTTILLPLRQSSLVPPLEEESRFRTRIRLPCSLVLSLNVSTPQGMSPHTATATRRASQHSHT